jgi:hypothetical protein
MQNLVGIHFASRAWEDDVDFGTTVGTRLSFAIPAERIVEFLSENGIWAAATVNGKKAPNPFEYSVGTLCS